MSKNKRRLQQMLASEASNQFVRGFIATGLLAARPAPVISAGAGKKILHQAVRGAVAISAATAGSNAFQRKNYGGALLAAAVGACGITLTDRLFSRPSTCNKESVDE